MQRLIDANELRMSIILPRCGAKTIIGDAVQKMIDSAPTVDAIPIEWIEKQRKGMKKGSDREQDIGWLLEEWRKEHAAID